MIAVDEKIAKRNSGPKSSPKCLIDVEKLNLFLHRVIDQTGGWNFVRLMNLHKDFSKFILWKYIDRTDRSSLLKVGLNLIESYLSIS